MNSIFLVLILLASRKLEHSKALADKYPNTRAISLDVNNDKALEDEVAKYDLIISLIPYIHHARVIAAAVKHKKHVVTTSYISPAMKAFDQA